MKTAVRGAFAAVIALAAAVCCAAGFASASTPHVLRYNFDAEDITSLNPFLALSSSTESLSELTMARFVRFDDHGNAIPDLITEIPSTANHGVSPDGRTITWHLRHNVRWSDGAPFTSSDVTFTYRVAMDPANSVTRRDVWERLSGVDAPDPYTVVFRFKQPYALFIADYFSTLSQSCVLPRHVIGPATAINDAPYNALPVGIGPFRYTAYRRGDSIEMEANPYYWRGKPKLAKIIYKIIPDDNTNFTQLQTGELDLWDLITGPLAQRAKTLPGVTIASRLSNAVAGIRFNVERPALRDPRVRRALRLATDRSAAIEKTALGYGVAQESVVASITHDYLALPNTPYDPAAAARLLDAAGWKRGSDGTRSKNGVPLTIELVIPNAYAPSASFANILHDDWGAIGVAVTIHPYANAQLFQPASAGGPIFGGKFDAAIFSNGPGPVYANIDGLYDCKSIPPNGFNVDRYCNPAVDALNERYVRSFDPAVRAQAAVAFQRIINDDAPVAVVYLRAELSAYTSRLQGFHPSSFSDWGDPLELDI